MRRRRRRARRGTVAARTPGVQRADPKRRTMRGGWVNPDTLPKTEDGRPACRWCGNGVDPPRRTFCSADCVHEHRCRTSPAYLRSQLFAKEHGVCALCGFDTRSINRMYWQLRDEGRRQEADAWLQENGVPLSRKVGRRYGVWDMDHIVPVFGGGGCCGLENVRTLCLPCHKAQTASQASARAAAR